METIVFLSPHYDDVVLSCSSYIQDLIRNDKKVVVVTVFTFNQHERKQENIEAIKLLGADWIDLDIKDAPERDYLTKRDGRILFGETSDDLETFELIIQSLKSLDINPSEVYAPLGIGWHIDHLLVHQAATELFKHNLYFYEDAPYNFSRAQRNLRFEINETHITEFLTEFFSLQYVKTWLGHWNKEHLYPLINSLKPLMIKASPFLAVTLTENHQNLKLKIKAIQCYHSQVKSLFKNEVDLEMKLKLFPEEFYKAESYE